MKKFKVLLIYPNTMMATLLPLSISSLSASLKQAGIEVELFDTTFYKTESIGFEKKKEWLLQVKPFEEPSYKQTDLYEDLKKMVDNYQPNLIGISLVEDTIDQGLKLLESIKDYDCPVVAGGVGVNWNYKKLLAAVDLLCFGEGEKYLVTLIQKHNFNFMKGEIFEYSIPEVSTRNSILPKPLDINKLPYPDFDIFEKNRIERVMHGEKYRMLHVELDRGCPYNCTYCCAPAIRKMYKPYKYYRRKSNDRIIEEMKYLKKKYKPDYLNFNSECFLARPDSDLKELMKTYKKEIDLPFWCQSRLHLVTDKKIRWLKEAGCADMQFGIECGNEEFRKKWLKRNETNEQMLKALDIVEKHKISYTTNSIIGFPNETENLIFSTMDINIKISPKTMNVYMMTPYKGTLLYSYCVKEGLLDPEAKTKQLLGGSDIKYKYLTKKQLLGLQRIFPLYVKRKELNIPFNEIMQAKTNDELFLKLRKKYIERYYK